MKMRRESGSSSSAVLSSNTNGKPKSDVHGEIPKRSAFTWLALCFILLNSAWAIYHYQYERLPAPLTAEQAGKRGFSEHIAMDHVEALTRLGPHPVGSDALELAVQYVLKASEKIKKTAHWEVDIQLDLFHAKSGANRLTGGLFKGKTLVYSDLKHVVLRILPKYLPEAEDSAILVSSHIDTVFSSEGAGDCSSCVAVMLELARAVSQWAHGFKKSVIFLFNTGEEDGLNGAHSFITQHPWSKAICLAVDLEAMGIGGKSGIFQSGPDPWAIESFARAAKYPSAQIIGQDLFVSGVIKSATDYQVYSELAGLSGLDFAFTDVVAVYHTKNDKLRLLKAGSLQHLGDNMLAFLLQTAAASYTPGRKEMKMREDNVYNQMVYFDVLGTYMVLYSERLANLLHNSLIVQGLLIWVTSLFVGGFPAVVSLFLSVLSVVLMWMFSLSLAVPVAFLISKVSSSPVPYIANPWLVLGLFGAPAVLGALIGQQIGYHILQKYLLHASLRNSVKSVIVQVEEVKWEAERWLFKAGFLQWLLILLAGNIYKVGSSYVALVWLVSPAFAYGLIEATLTPMRSPKPLRILTLILGLSVPVLISAGAFIRMMGTLIGILVRLDRNPGSTPEWLGSVVLATIMVAIVCLTFVYLLSYAHLSGARRAVILATCSVFSLTVGMISAGVIHPFTDDVARAIHVVHVVDTTGGYSEIQNPVSYISLFSYTPGKLTKEAESLKDEGFFCGKEKVLDLVTFSVEYGCYSSYDTEHGWSEAEIPILQVESDLKEDARITRVSLDTKVSTRWTLAINTREIKDFKFEGNSEKLIPLGNKTGVDGWHIIQFAGGKNAPTKYEITLFWYRNSTHPTQTDEKQRNQDSHLLLKLRTDVNRITPKTARVLGKLPSWCSLFGKSTSPYTLAFLTSLPVEI